MIFNINGIKVIYGVCVILLGVLYSFLGILKWGMIIRDFRVCTFKHGHSRPHTSNTQVSKHTSQQEYTIWMERRSTSITYERWGCAFDDQSAQKCQCCFVENSGWPSGPHKVNIGSPAKAQGIIGNLTHCVCRKEGKRGGCTNTTILK